FAMNANGHGVKQITRGGGSENTPSVSPNGQSIAFDGFFPDVAPDGVQGIYLTGKDGGSYADFRRLTVAPAGGYDTSPDFSPDGTKIVFAHFLPTGFFTQLRVMNADGSNVHVIWQGADFSYDVRPAWGSRP